MEAVNNMFIYLLTFLSCVSLFYALVKALRNLWWTPNQIQRALRLQGIQGPPYKFIQGNMAEIFSTRMKAMSKPMELSHRIIPRVMPHTHLWLNNYGKIFLQWFGIEPQLIITDPKMISEVLHDREKNYPKAKLHAPILRIFGNGLVTAEGEKWAKVRKIANFAFHGENLRNMIPIMTTCAEIMINGWRIHEVNELNVFEELKVFASDVISHTAFGSSYIEGKNIFDLLEKLCLLSIKDGYRIRIPGISKIFKSKDDREGERVEKRMKESLVDMIKKREAKFMSGEADNYGNDFFGLLVKAKNDPEESQRISVDDIVDECKTFYFAGHETTTALIAWTVFLLAMHKDWQEQARNEVVTIFGSNNPTPEGLAKLKTMTMIINECLRLYPPAMTVSRQVEKEVKLGNLILPNKLQLTIPTVVVQHDTEIWGEDAHLFNPERFSEGIAKATKQNSAAFSPFGLGPRNCVGMNFAITEAKITMSMILQRYSFTLSPAYTHAPVQFLTVCPQHGIHIILEPISDEKGFK